MTTDEFIKNTSNSVLKDMAEILRSGIYKIHSRWDSEYVATATELDTDTFTQIISIRTQISRMENPMESLMSALVDGMQLNYTWTEDRNSHHGLRLDPHSELYCCGLSLEKVLNEYQEMLNQKLRDMMDDLLKQRKLLKAQLKSNQKLKSLQIDGHDDIIIKVS